MLLQDVLSAGEDRQTVVVPISRYALGFHRHSLR